MGVRNDVTEFARLDGCTGERDRLCRFHRHRDLVIRRKIERQALVRTQISKMERNQRPGCRPSFQAIEPLLICTAHVIDLHQISERWGAAAGCRASGTWLNL